MRRVRIIDFDMWEWRLRKIKKIKIDDIKGIIEDGLIRKGWEGGKERRIVERNIREKKRKKIWRVGWGRKNEKIDGGKVFEKRINGRNGWEGGKKRIVEGDLVLKSNELGRWR